MVGTREPEVEPTEREIEYRPCRAVMRPEAIYLEQFYANCLGGTCSGRAVSRRIFLFQATE
jgi:uncharacterized protein (DUF169 family)